MDLEGYTKNLTRKRVNRKEIKEKVVERILEFKDLGREKAEELAEAILNESKATLDIEDEFIGYEKSGVNMGEFGVGSRGMGDFYVHEKISEVIGRTSAEIDSTFLDDSGAVREDGSYIVVSVDGMHSRLSDFPFLAGFHVTRATLRDIYVMGARPIALLSDIHLADDGDVTKIFDHIAGISSVSDVMGVPLITGSTLRIGGDMVIGDRMTGCVGAVGIAKDLTARIDAEPGDVILMTEGAGGGTISTAALYYDERDVVTETLNVKFLKTCDALIESGMTRKIHAMTDITNGGIRGDANEIAKVAGVKLVFYEKKIRDLVNKKVFDMLERHKIDYLGVSLDSLLIICPEDAVSEVEKVLNGKIKIDEIGRVEGGEGSEIVIDGRMEEFVPRFRESPYTPVKKIVGEYSKNSDLMREKVRIAADRAIKKKEKMIEILRSSL